MKTLVSRIAQTLALLGGALLVFLVVLTCLSVIGRSLNTIGNHDFMRTNAAWLAGFLQNFGPINGDFEIVEAGIAFAIMAFFPWCMVNRGHATVDIFTSTLPTKANRWIEFLWSLLFAVVLGVITWRLYVGTTDKMRYGETSFMLQFPVWWGFAACTFAAVFATIVAVYVAFDRLTEIGKSQPEGTAGGEH